MTHDENEKLALTQQIAWRDECGNSLVANTYDHCLSRLEYLLEQTPAAGGDAIAEIKRLRVENNLHKNAVDRWVPCPDHRDKTERGKCYVCENESLRRKLTAIEQSRVQDSGAVNSWTCACGDVNYPSEVCGVCNQSAPQPAAQVTDAIKAAREFNSTNSDDYDTGWFNCIDFIEAALRAQQEDRKA